MISIVVDTRSVMAFLDSKFAAAREGAVEGLHVLARSLYSSVMLNLSGRVLNSRTGRLKSAMLLEVKDTGNVIQASITPQDSVAPYWKFQELGVPHSWLIEAKAAKALRFNFNGETVFKKRVTHPGLPARSFLGVALSTIDPYILSTLQGEMNARL